MNDKSYKNWVSMSDEALIQTIGKFIKQKRLNQNKTQQELATITGMSRSTISLLERGETVTLSTLIQALRALDLLHVMDVFEVSDTLSPLEYAKLKREQRQRASNKSGDSENEQTNLGW